MGILAGGAVVGYGLREAGHPARSIRWSVPIPALPPHLEGFTILHLTDLHGRALDADREAMVEVAEDGVDAVVMTGDVLSRGDLAAGRSAVELVADLARTAPLFYCPGNHDYAPDGSVAPGADLRAAGATVLVDGNAPGPRGTVFVGVGDPQTYRDDLDEALRDLPPGFPLVLAHSPTIFPRVARRGLPLMLAGHTHGGQGRIPGIGTVWVPGQRGLFPEYDRGIFRRNGSVLVLSSGIGTSGPPFRYFVPPEFLIVTLHRVEDDIRGV